MDAATGRLSRSPRTGTFAIDRATFDLSSDSEGPLSELSRNGVKPGVRLDYETAPEYRVAVAVSDGGSPPLEVSAVARVVAIDVNEPPSLMLCTDGEDCPWVFENSEVGTELELGRLEYVDPDAGDAVTFDQLSNNEGLPFELP